MYVCMYVCNACMYVFTGSRAGRCLFWNSPIQLAIRIRPPLRQVLLRLCPRHSASWPHLSASRRQRVPVSISPTATTRLASYALSTTHVRTDSSLHTDHVRILTTGDCAENWSGEEVQATVERVNARVPPALNAMQLVLCRPVNWFFVPIVTRCQVHTAQYCYQVCSTICTIIARRICRI